MKLKLPLLIFGTFIFPHIFSQDISMDVQKKKILLEEFTGIHCGYCPQGHAIANNLLNAQPDNFYTIAIHAGYYAVPGSDEPEFRINEGSIINDEFEVSGYPSGTINRHAFEGSDIITGRSSWTKDAKSINQEDAPVNLLLISEFNGDTRELTITVRGYYTLDIEDSFHLLNVAITQSNIKGPQNGGGVGNDYIHNHMLRAFVTPVWGDTIKNPVKGESFTKEYIYTLPSDVNNVELLAEEIEIIAYITVDKKEVLNVTGVKPSYINYSKALMASIHQPAWTMGTYYGYNYFDAKIKNESDKTITAISFDVIINGNSQAVQWTGNIPAFHTEPIIIHVEPYEIENSNEYEIQIVSINNESITGNSITGSFSKPVESTENISIELQTDLYADENTFVIKDQDGNIIHEFGPYETNERAVYNEEITLEKDRMYCFEITDEWADGIQQPRGYYKIYSDGDRMIAQNYDITLFGAKVFFRTSYTSTALKSDNEIKPGIFYNSIQRNIEIEYLTEHSGDVAISLYSTTGNKIFSTSIKTETNQIQRIEIPVSSFANGVYFINIQQGQKKETYKVAIY